jgi:dolichyl-phosphate beta-glucosyltransferase
VHLSLVIPAFNEERCIEETLATLEEYLSRQDYDSEIVVVDDGSSDETAARVEADFPDVRMISYQPNCGKGHAVKTGMLAATGAFRVYYDADGSTPIEEVEKLWPRFEDGASVVIGSRTVPDSDVRVRQALYRQTMGRIFNLFVRLLAIQGFPDTQCGFKGFTAEASEAVFRRQTVERFGFDAEVLYIARRHGFRIDQIGIRWINCPHTSVHPVLDSAAMFRDLVGIFVKRLLGTYR